MRKAYMLFVAVLAAALFAGAQETPTAGILLQKIRKTLEGVRTLSYESEFTNFNSGIDDSLSVSKGRVWLKMVPEDTIFGTHLHVAYQGSGGRSDYYYDGTKAIDIWHEHKVADQARKITVIEPLLLGNGYNRVQSRVSVLPYFHELVNMKALGKWLTRDSITVKEDPSGKYWVLEWPENSVQHNFFSTRRLLVDKKTHFIVEMHRHSTWNGTRMRNDLVIKNIQVNRPGDEDGVALRESYPDYRTAYESNKNTVPAKAAFSFTGQKAVDFSYPSFDGQQLSLKAPKGKLLLLDFWETWCGYCYVAMPRLKDLHRKYNAEGLEIIGIVTENRNGVQQVLDAQRFPYPTVFADSKLLQQYKVQARPTYLLIDDTGTIIDHSIGSLDQIEKSVNERFAKKEK